MDGFTIESQLCQRRWISLTQSNEEYSALLLWPYDDKFMGVAGYVDINETYLAHVIILVKEFNRVEEEAWKENPNNSIQNIIK